MNKPVYTSADIEYFFMLSYDENVVVSPLLGIAHGRFHTLVALSFQFSKLHPLYLTDH